MGTTAESRTAYLEKMRYRSYFIWLQKAVGKLYGISDPITAENWDMISEQIHKAHQNPSFYLDVLENLRNCSGGITPTTVSYRYGTDHRYKCTAAKQCD